MWGIIISIAFLIIIIGVLNLIYEPRIDCIQDVDLNKIWIVWYNEYTDNGVVREHKILYDTGRDKR